MHRSSCLFTYRRASVCFNTDNSLLVVANALEKISKNEFAQFLLTI